MEWRPARWLVCLPLLIFPVPLHYKVLKFSSGTGSPGWSRKKGRKMAVVWCGGATSKHHETIKTTKKTKFTVCGSFLCCWRRNILGVFDGMKNVLVVGIQFVFIVEETKASVVLLLRLHHYLHLNAVLRDERCRTLNDRMHLLSLWLQHNTQHQQRIQLK